MTWLLHQMWSFWPCLLVFLLGLFGSAIVFFFKNISRKLLDIMMALRQVSRIGGLFWSYFGISLFNLCDSKWLWKVVMVLRQLWFLAWRYCLV